MIFQPQTLPHPPADLLEQPPRWEGGLADLIDHIVAVHHGYLRQQLSLLCQETQSVTAEQGQQYPYLLRVNQLLHDFTDQIARRLDKEESVVFPQIRRLEWSLHHPGCYGGELPALCLELHNEHRLGERFLAELRQLTDHYTPPSDATPYHRQLLVHLAELDADLCLHTYKEDHLLLPRAAQLESQLAGSRTVVLRNPPLIA